MKILALDDEKMALVVLCSAIENAIPGAEILSFRSPEQALEALRQSAVDVVFCDYKMPGMTGIEFGRQLKRIRPRTDIVFVTGYSEYAADAVNELAPQGYIVKPVSPAKIQAVLKNLHSSAGRPGLYAQTFGNFELFFDRKPVTFKVKKAKELLAYLIDRNGASVTRRDLLAVLYEDKDENNARRYFTDAVSCLTETLASLGAESVLVRSFNAYSVDKSGISCDLFDYLDGSVNLFRGEYMTQYDWSEFSIAELFSSAQ